MVAVISSVETARDTFLAELTEAALKVAVRRGIHGPSVDLEIDLWNALGAVLRQTPPADLPAGVRWEHRLARLTEAAYHVALAHGFAGPFVELEIDLWRALRQAIRTLRFLPGRLPGTHHVSPATRLPGAPPHLSSVLDIR